MPKSSRPPSPTRFTGRYKDGVSPEVRPVLIEATRGGLILLGDDGREWLRWPAGEIRRVGHAYARERHRTDTRERLESDDPGFHATIAALAPALSGGGSARRWQEWRLVAWGLGTIAAGVMLLVLGAPALAGLLTPLVPWRYEASLGLAVEPQIIASLAGGPDRICARRGPGRAALDRLTAQLVAQAELPGPITVTVADSDVENAFALPGGRIVFMRRTLENARSVDEIAGVMAHELGHVAGRDSLRAMVHAGGLSFIGGALLGDVTGAGALLIATRTLLGNRYSRDAETAADLFAIDLMIKAGGDVSGLARFLERLARDNAGPKEGWRNLLSTHPVTAERIALIRARQETPGVAPRAPLLSPAEFAALQAICRNG